MRVASHSISAPKNLNLCFRQLIMGYMCLISKENDISLKIAVIYESKYFVIRYNMDYNNHLYAKIIKNIGSRT